MKDICGWTRCVSFKTTRTSDPIWTQWVQYITMHLTQLLSPMVTTLAWELQVLVIIWDCGMNPMFYVSQFPPSLYTSIEEWINLTYLIGPGEHGLIKNSCFQGAFS